jgi:cyclopropane-fatty-acyl-phospholipid synthase
VTAQGASAEAIRHHYDVSNDFYRLWLDPGTMSYTAALFDGADAADDLSRAQQRKVDHHVSAARARGAERVLDIGCGWGNMLFSLVGRHAVKKAVGLTLSDAQARYVLDRGDPRVEVRTESYRRHVPDQPYDAIVSVEAIEAFARLGLSRTEKTEIYRDLFERAHAWLKPSGWFSLQMIAYGNAPDGAFDSFIARDVFPESDLPRLSEIMEACDGLFSVESLRNDRADYARTLRGWIDGLRGHREEAIGAVGPAVVRRYDEYLRLCVYMFDSGACDLHRVAFRRIDAPHARRRRA